MTAPTNNGFAHWYGVVDESPPPGYSVSIEWIHAGIANGTFNGNAGYPETSAYYWFTEVSNWCNGYHWYGHGTYTANTTQYLEVYHPDGTYGCGSGGAVTVYMVRNYFNGQLAVTDWILSYGSQLRAQSGLEYYPYDYLNPAGTVCFGSGGASSGCPSSSNPVARLQSATWANWNSSDTWILESFGYNQTTQVVNYRYNATSPY